MLRAVAPHVRCVSFHFTGEPKTTAAAGQPGWFWMIHSTVSDERKRERERERERERGEREAHTPLPEQAEANLSGGIIRNWLAINARNCIFGHRWGPREGVNEGGKGGGGLFRQAKPLGGAGRYRNPFAIIADHAERHGTVVFRHGGRVSGVMVNQLDWNHSPRQNILAIAPKDTETGICCQGAIECRKERKERSLALVKP